MNHSFEKLGVNAPIAVGLRKTGIVVPTAIQQQVIPSALLGKDVIGQSATGTGKTFAYLLPLIQKADTNKREMQAIILAPTHELAIQIQRQIEVIAKNAGLPVTAAPVIGNVNIERQIEKLKEKPQIIVGSSGRILELIHKKKISAHTIKTIVLDEADRLLDDNNYDSVKAVIKTTLRDRQIMAFSATITAAAMDRLKELLQSPVIIRVESQGQVPAAISHVYFVAERRDKIEMLRKLANSMNMERALVFINNSDNIEVTVAKLNYHGLTAAGLYGNLLKLERKAALADFRDGKIRILVASDLAARGLDISGVTHVINLDLPEDPQVYLHRAGRTGRAGQTGAAVSIVAGEEAVLIKKFAKVLNISIIHKNIAKGRIIDVK